MDTALSQVTVDVTVSIRWNMCLMLYKLFIYEDIYHLSN